MEGIISKTVENLVIDSKALIVGGLKLKDKAQNYFTIEEVFKEVRHKQAREELNLLPFELKVRVPSEEAMKMVVEFAKKTGDFDILSKVDLRVLALTLTIEKELNGLDHIRSSPIPIQNNLNSQNDEDDGDYCEDEAEEGEELEGEGDNITESKEEVTSKLDDLNINGEESEASKEQDESAQIDEDDEDEDEDDEDGWITPSNLKQKIEKEYDLPEDEYSNRPPVKVACITGDYAMQRVLLQMNMNLFSIDGEHIKRINNFVMRCHACYQITTDLSKQFCPKCGGNTLMRTTTSIDQNGNMTYYLKRNFNYRLRGTRYSIPNPKGGHKNKDLILREDTPHYQRRLAYNNRRKEQDLFDPDFIPEILVGRDSNRFDPSSLRIGYGRKNPNQAKRRTGKKKH